ncbi:hypothetical protein BDB00DRAFT_874171 [Zychaea mexicana]|uniref:uncharacterized protein n=1 Tax=Zychaea mexicana TaxID=64656 RepID=UPI0022FE686B|nr:uncharacterized protein BDB00DRAFT_874171 [Zychaea mexicana]KAI9491607.1 hypothetical protein BDB00DRAFT_874171 [Zychaea mexicana]
MFQETQFSPLQPEDPLIAEELQRLEQEHVDDDVSAEEGNTNNSISNSIVDDNVSNNNNDNTLSSNGTGPKPISDEEIEQLLMSLVSENELSENNDRYEIQHIPSSQGYNLSLNPNKEMPCYIDAVVETFWHSLLPYIARFNPITFTEPSNDDIFALTLHETFMNCQSGDRNRSFAASRRMRNFVCGLKVEEYDDRYTGLAREARLEFRFRRGGDGDYLSNILEDYLKHMPNTFIQNFVFEMERINACSVNDGHRHLLAIWDLIIDRSTNEKCDYRKKPAIEYNWITSNSPLFLLLVDITDRVKIPDSFHFQYGGRVEYSLHAIMSSTRRTGLHCKGTAIIPHHDEFLAVLDYFTKHGIIILHENVTSEDKEKAFAQIKHPLVACYMKVTRVIDVQGRAILDDDDFETERELPPAHTTILYR